ASCGDGKWGDIPAESATQFVDASYPNADSNGSMTRPWVTIQAAIAAAPPYGVVAIAAGSYPENISVTGKAVRLWGRCPQMVELGAISVIGAGASKTEIHDIAASTTGAVVTITGATDVALEELWIHGSADRGIRSDDSGGPTALVLRKSLVEGT